MSNQDIIIFSAGRWCESAVFYYSQISKIRCLVDNDSKLWGTWRYGVEICPPKVIKENKNSVIVIANEKYESDIRKQIIKDYGERIIVSFRIKFFEDWDMYNDNIVEMFETQNKEELIIEYSGGIGNQMFQYAFMCYLRKMGKNTTCDLSRFIHIQTPECLKRPITEVFKKINMRKCNSLLREKYKLDGFDWYKEQLEKNGIFSKDNAVFNMEHGYISGYFQAYQYADCCRDELLEAFSTSGVLEGKLGYLAETIKKGEYVSIHLRMGDYFRPEVISDMGAICTKDYYSSCVKDILDKNENSDFIIFSNDIECAKREFYIEGALYISEEMFDGYDDWYDIYLMSLCKHNIIANSSFSWWGAWLNQNKNKMVYRPEKWTNSRPFSDICPPEWIKVNALGEIIGNDASCEL